MEDKKVYFEFIGWSNGRIVRRNTGQHYRSKEWRKVIVKCYELEE